MKLNNINVSRTESYRQQNNVTAFFFSTGNNKYTHTHDTFVSKSPKHNLR